MQFLQPWWFLLLALLPLFWWWWKRQSPASIPLSGALDEQLPTTWRTRLMRFLPVLSLLGLAFLIVALARPVQIETEEEINADGIDIFLVMDLSESMLAKDFTPNRLEVAKIVADSFIAHREYDRIGLSVFAAEAFALCPLTSDHGVVRALLKTLAISKLKQGTAIGEGLGVAVNRMKDSKAKSKVAIVLTDGDNNAGYIQPDQAANAAETFGVKVYTIGVGSNGNTQVPGGFFGSRRMRVTLNEPLLRQIAEQTGGRYFRATSAQKLEEIYAEIDRLEKTKIEVTRFQRNKEFFRIPLGLGIVFLLISLLAQCFVFKISPQF